GADRKGLRPEHRIERQPGVKVREQGAAARRLVAKRGTETSAVDREEHEVGLAAEVERGSLGYLSCGREMDVAIGVVDGRTGKDAGLLRLPPERRRAGLVDRRHFRFTPFLADGIGEVSAGQAPPNNEIIVVKGSRGRGVVRSCAQKMRRSVLILAGLVLAGT